MFIHSDSPATNVCIIHYKKHQIKDMFCSPLTLKHINFVHNIELNSCLFMKKPSSTLHVLSNFLSQVKLYIHFSVEQNILQEANGINWNPVTPNSVTVSLLNLSSITWKCDDYILDMSFQQDRENIPSPVFVMEIYIQNLGSQKELLCSHTTPS